MSRTDRGVLLNLFLLLAGLYAVLSGGHTYSSDEETMYATTRAIAERGDVAIEVIPENEFVIREWVRPGRTGDLVGIYGMGQSIVAIPFYVAGQAFATQVGADDVDFTTRIFIGWTNALVTAAGAGVFYLIARLVGASREAALALTLVYGLATMVLPHARTFFSEPLATTLTLTATYLALRAGSTGSLRYVAASGALGAAALFARGSCVVFAPVLCVYLIWRLSRGSSAFTKALTVASRFGAGALPVLLLFALSNWWRFGNPLDLGYQIVPFDTPLLRGLHGLFLSPGKSVFLYAPAALAGLLAVPFAPRERRPETWLFLGLALVNALFFARFQNWHGDHAWGPRYMVMSIPFLILPLAPLLHGVRWRAVLAAAALAGVPSALLGTVMYFNQYFAIASPPTELSTTRDFRDREWVVEVTRWHPEWSPIRGHALHLPGLIENTRDGFDGESSTLPAFPRTTTERYLWHGYPPQLDVWWYWIFPAHGSKELLLFLPLFAGAAVLGSVGLFRRLRDREVGELEQRSAWAETLPVRGVHPHTEGGAALVER